MYVRTTRRRNADGSEVAYVALAHNHRQGSKTRTEVLLNLGRAEAVDQDGLRRLVSSISRYLGDVDPYAGHAQPGDQLRVTASRSLGGVWLLHGLWDQLGVADALAKAMGGRRFATDVERVLFALVANRALAPCSKLAATDWVADVAIPGLEGFSEDQAYRAMDLLIEADAAAKVQEGVFFATANLLNLEVDLLLFDTTSSYFQADPDVNEDGTPGFRRLGHSKDHRPDLPQIIIGLAVTREGIPVRVWCWPGNTADVTVLPEVRDGMRDWKLGRVVTVVDRGFSSDANLDYLRRGGGGWIAGERMRDHSPDAVAALGRQGRYTIVDDHLHVKEAKLEATPGVRWIICHNPAQATRDAATRTAHLDRIRTELERISTARTKATTALAGATTDKARTKLEAELAGHAKAECALRDNRALGRYLKQRPDGRLVIDTAKVTSEAKLDGKYLISTSEPHLTPAQIAVAYRNLLQAERGFRDLKSTLDLRPMFHRIEPRIRAHVLISWLALLLIRVAETRTNSTWNQLTTGLTRIHAVTLTGPAGTIIQTTELTDHQTAIYRACQLPTPPRLGAATPR